MAEDNYYKLLKNMLAVSKKYANAINENDSLCFFGIMSEPDESGYIGIRKINGKIKYYFFGNHFGDYHPKLEPSIKIVVKQLKKFNADPKKIVENFKSALAKPLERYLVNKELKNLEKRLLK